jgi:plastocyanin
MKRNRLFITIGLACILCMGIIQATQITATAADDCRIVRVQGKDNYGGVRLEPEFVTVAKGACVIWTNWVRGLEIQIIFEEGKSCKDATQSPTGFTLNTEKNCFVTTWLDMGQTSSLIFAQNGTYRYTVETKSGEKLKGTIVVGD